MLHEPTLFGQEKAKDKETESTKLPHRLYTVGYVLTIWSAEVV